MTVYGSLFGGMVRLRRWRLHLHHLVIHPICTNSKV